ncbi:MAG: hypothetical protein EHM40_16690 [Chloroflexi bacterium]|nr:MAG: hypothetical protein EHM40_16690 [Chloroflexota bacterium]
MATSNVAVTVKQALGAALVEVLTGNLTDETIAAVDAINKEEVPPHLRDIVNVIHGMSTHSVVRESVSHHVLGELYAAAEDAFKQRLNA